MDLEENEWLLSRDFMRRRIPSYKIDAARILLFLRWERESPLFMESFGGPEIFSRIRIYFFLYAFLSFLFIYAFYAYAEGSLLAGQ